MNASALHKEFNNWKIKNRQHGRQAFSRFMMLKFLDALSAVSNDFIFKGGNLLWHYIGTPRQTIDLDLVTIKSTSHHTVKKSLNQASKFYSEVEFSVKEFKEIDTPTYSAAAAIVGYKTVSGQLNQFSLDIVYALPTETSKVKSTINGNFYISASIENIIADKIQAAHKFGSGNTRMKDFDDLWRISKSDLEIDGDVLKKLLMRKQISCILDAKWIPNLKDSWLKHSKLYKEVPSELDVIFTEVNSWLNSLNVSL